MFRKSGSYRTPTPDQRALSIIDRKDHDRWFRQVWTDIPGQMRAQSHPAPFPKELAFRLISMFSFVGDIVPDPFWGTGTTTAAAIEAHRSSIGYEIEPRYLEIGKARFRQSYLDARVDFFDSGPGKETLHSNEVFTAKGHCDVRARGSLSTSGNAVITTRGVRVRARGSEHRGHPRLPARVPDCDRTRGVWSAGSKLVLR